MLAKLMTLLAATKGATVAAVIVLGTATVTVGAASPEVQDTVHNVVETVTGQTVEAAKTDCDHGQPAAVAQRNAAGKLLGAAFQTHHKALEDLRGKGVDNQAAGALIKTADDKLKDIRTTALNDVAKLTLGREGQTKDGDATAPNTSAETPVSCPAETEESVTKPAESNTDSAKPSQEGRVTVAQRTTLDAKIKAIVDKAVADMDALVTDAQAKVGALPAAEHGTKPAGNPSEDHKPTNTPKR